MSEDEILLTHILKCKSVDLLINKPILTSSQELQFQDYKQRRQKGEPLQYIIGSWDFYGLEFVVDPSVLVPRPETESLVELALKRFKGKSILDLGTGSGCIAITLAKFLPGVKIVTVDISSQALMIAKANAKRHDVEVRIEFVHADMEEFLEKEGSFDLIISNPPYIPSAAIKQLPLDVQQEPAMALDGGADGLDFYRIITKYSPRLLSVDACLMMEFGDGQGKAIETLMNAQGCFFEIEIINDLTDRERIIYGKIRH